jgi:hypothetical protein
MTHEPAFLLHAVRPAFLLVVVAPMIQELRNGIWWLLVVAAFLCGWWAQGWRMSATLAKQETAQAKAAQTQTQQALGATETKANARIDHAGQQQDNTHAYTQKLRELEAARIADAGRIERLQHDLRVASTAHAQAASNAAACGNLADRHQQLTAHLAEGTAVVAGLGGLVKERDSQAAALKAQVLTDRQLLEGACR